MGWKVLITARSFGQGDPEPFRILTQAKCEVVKSPLDRPLTGEELGNLIGDADAVIVGNDIVDASVIERGRALKVISRYGVGTDNIDIAAASMRGIYVTNTPGANDHSVADLAVGMMIALARGIPKVYNWTRAGEWKRFFGSEIYGKVLGVIGVGRIGREVVRRVQGFDMRTLCYDIKPDQELISKYQVEYLDLDEVLRKADFVSIHVPLLPSTRKLIGKRELGLMKATAYLINLARGGIVDEDALYDALQGGAIAGAAIDVFEKEPPVNSPLIQLDNIIVTPHIGGYTVESVKRMSTLAAENVISVLRGEACKYVVNPEAQRA